MDSELVFSYLLAELAAQRGDLGTAYGHYLHAAILAQDAYAAERATRIAIYRKDVPAALRASERWVDLAPNDLQARQTAVYLFVRAGDSTAALAQAEALLQIADALGQDGYLQLAGVLGKGHSDLAGLQLMRELAARHATEAHAQFALAVVEEAAQDATAAEASLRRALALQPDWAKPRVLLARMLTSLGRGAEARAMLQEGVQQYPDDVLLRNAYARTLVEASAYAEALEQFRRLRQQLPDDDEILYAIAVLAGQTRQWDEAREAWQTLRNLGKRYDEATYYLGQVEEQAGKPAVAAGLYAAVQEGPLRVDAALRLAQLRAAAGALNESREVLQRARVLEPERAVDVYLAETRILAEHGQQEDVLSVYATALQAYPEHPDLLYNRAIYAAEQGLVDAAERDLMRLLATDPNHVDALNALGYTLADQTDRYQEAYGYIRKAYELKPDSAAILDSLGWVYYRMGQHEQALKYLRQALERMADPEIAAHLGEVLWVTGDRADARRVWGEARAAHPEHRKLRAVMEQFD